MRLGTQPRLLGRRATTRTTSPWPRRPTGSATRWCWAAEAYGSDAPTVLAWVAAQTERIDVGTAILQIPARTPAMTAMTAATLDTLSGGRFRLGLGVSGPQVSEGWHGVRFDKPLARTREYVEIVRTGAAPRDGWRYEGEHYTLPLPGRPGQGAQADRPPGPRAHPDLPRRGRPEEPGADRRDRRRLAADLLRPPEHAGELRSATVRAGRAKAGQRPGRLRRRADRAGGRRRRPAAPAPTRSARTPRSTSAAWAAGEQNFYNQLAAPDGLRGRGRARSRTSTWPSKQREAAAAVPLEFIDRTSLLGPPERIADRLPSYAEAGVTHAVSVSPYGPTAERPGRDRCASSPSAVERAGSAREPALGTPSCSASSRGSPSSCRCPAPGHLTILEQLLGYQIDAADVTAFTAIIQIGAMLADADLPARRFRRIVVRVIRGLFRPGWRADPDWKFGWAVVLGSIPIGIVGLLFQDADRRPAAQPVGRRRGADPVERADALRRPHRHPEAAARARSPGGTR